MRSPRKPQYVQPCNGCGRCCREEICQVGIVAFPDAVAPCPGLRTDATRTYCKLVEVEDAAGMQPILREGLGIGIGCTMPDDDPTTMPLLRIDSVVRFMEAA